MKRRTSYLNTDLDIHSAEDLRPLARALTRGDLITLYVGQDAPAKSGHWFAVLEANAMARSPNGHMKAMLKAIETLGPRPRAIWDRCLKREFNLGYECGSDPWCFTQNVSKQIMRRMTQAGLSFRITLYGSEDDDK